MSGAGNSNDARAAAASAAAIAMQSSPALSSGEHGAGVQFDSQVTISLRLSPTAQAYQVNLDRTGAQVVPLDGAGQPATTFDESNNSGNVTELKIDFDQLPQPYFTGKILGDITPHTLRSRVISAALYVYPRVYPWLGRAPTQEESDTMSWYIARGVQQGSVGPFLGTTLALTRAALTVRRGVWHLPIPFRVPFTYGRGANFDPGVLKFMGREILKGPSAATVHRFFRSTLYGFTGYALGTFYYSYRVQSSIMQSARDPKLADITKATNQAGDAMRSNIKAQLQGGPGSRDGARSTRTSSADQGGNSHAERFERWGHRGGRSMPKGDDASPTSGQGMPDDVFAQPETVNEDRFAQASSESEGRPGNERFAEYQPQSRSRDQASPAITSRPQPSSTDGAPRGGSDDFFSDSPSTAEASPRAPPPSSQPVGSAWDRLRRGGAPSSPSTSVGSAPGPRATPTADSDDERSQAQKEFDAMLEKERLGEGSNARGSW